MKTLLAMRHAKSSWADPGQEDHERPLNKRGKKAAPRMGKLLSEENLTPDLIVSSSAVRARSTAEAVALTCNYRNEIRMEPRLYTAEPEAYLEVLAELSDDTRRVMVVGHNPGMEDLVAHLTGDNEPMPTAAIAHITLPVSEWSALNADSTGELVHVWRPKELD